MEGTTDQADVSRFTLHSINIITTKIENLIGSTCILSKSGVGSTINISGLQHIIDRLQIVEDTQSLVIYNQTVGTYTIPFMGPQGTVVPVLKYLPSLTKPMKDALKAIVNGQFQEYKKLEVDKLIGAAALDILL